MDDLISRQAAIDIVEFECGEWSGLARTIAKAIEQLPSADRPQGKWVWHEDEDICNCSRCDFEIDAEGCIDPIAYVKIYNFCPNCGARMKGADDE